MTVANSWNIRPIQWASVTDNELSERYYRMLLRWAAFAGEHFQDWSGRPNCGYFFGGCFPYGTDTSYIAAIFAVLSKIGPYDQEIARLPRQQVMEKAVKAIRYLALTHEQGPADCVRVEGKDPFYSGKKWGRKEEDYFRATQTGRSIAALCLAARFLWDELDLEIKELIQAIAASYADRWSKERPKSGTYNDTQEEENAWTAMGISAAMDLFPQHPHNEQWQQGFIRWSAGSLSTFRDSYIGEPVHRTQIPRTQGVAMFPVRAITLHPDYSTENHGFVHPNYMVAGIYLRAMHAVSALAGGCDILSSALYNNDEIYNRAIVQCAQRDGFLIPIQGQDWWYNSQHGNLVTHALLNVLHRSRDAARLERNALERIENIQRSNANGCFLEEKGAEYFINPLQTAQDVERLIGFNMLQGYLLHAFGGAGTEPSEHEELFDRLSGVHYYPYGSYIIHRTKHSLSSFSWRSNVMAVTLPANGLWSFTPLFTNYTGIVHFTESKGIRGLSNEQRVRDVEKYHIQQERHGFAAIATIARGDRELLQDVVFTALPDGRTVYMEQFRAVKACSTKDMQTGMIGIRNERYAALSDVAPGKKTLYLPESRDTFEGFYGGAPDEIKSYPAQPYVNVNDEMGFVLFGSHGIVYVNQHQFAKWKGVENTLVLNKIGERQLKQDEAVPPFVVVAIPNQTAEQTARSAQQTSLLTCDAERTTVLETEGYLVYGHFGEEDRIVNVRKNVGNRPFSVYDGNNRLEKGLSTWSGKLPAYRSGFVPAEYEVETDNGADSHLEFCVLADRVVIVNRSPRRATITVTARKDGRRQSFDIGSNGFEIFGQ